MVLPGFEHRLLHGGDYNPDQWLDRPDILEEDIRLMKLAHINSASVAIFAWAALEPEEGVYSFDWLESVINNLHSNGISVILATPSGARPAWMAQKYPEVLRVAKDMTRNQMGERHNHCFTSPVYREKVWQMNTRLARRFGSHPGVVLWHLSNEYGGECYCPLCQAAFRDWLREKYGTLDALNKAWWTAFWSHTYTSWDQIEAPVEKGEMNSHALALDWKRFTTHQTVDFCAHERKAVEAGGSTLPFTTNLMGFYEGLNYYKFRDVLDIASWDSYPEWHKPGATPGRLAAEIACAHDVMRCVKKQPFLLMESTPSVVNWNGVSKLKRPGMHELSSLQAVAHGANSVQYFQWRKSRGSSEKFHGAVVDHYGREDTRVFGDVAALGKRMENLGAVVNTNAKPEVALLYDWENRWAIDEAKGPRNAGMHYVETIKNHYEAFWNLGISVDVIDMEWDLDGYKLVVAPMLYMYRAGIAHKLRRCVQNGGTLVGTYFSGVVDETDLCFLGGAPGEGMAEVFGLRAEEIDALWDGEENALTFNGKRYTLTQLCERVIPTTAEPLAAYETDFYTGEPALLKNQCGSGTAWYLAAKAENAFYTDFYAGLCKEAGVKPNLQAALPQNVTASARVDENGQPIIFVQNYNNEDTTLELQAPYRDLETGESCTGALTLAPYSVRVLEPAL